MALLRFDKVSMAFGDRPLLDQVDLLIESGERVCLIGRNGAGKSTLLKLVAGLHKPDSGEIRLRSGARVGILHQDLPVADEQTVYDMVAGGLAKAGALLQQYHHLAQSIQTDDDLKRLERVQQELEAIDGWQLGQKVEQMIDRLQLPADKLMKELSGGWRRRVELARALVNEPDLLLLDEPTNHLDILTIRWLEQQLLDFRGALLFITHDRHFLQSLATRILELDRGEIYSWQGDYASYLDDRDHRLEVEQAQNAEFDKKLAQEEVWIRQGIKARRTRNEGRVRALKKLRAERKERRELQGQASFSLDEAARSGKLVLEARKLCKQFAGQPVVDQFSLNLMRGDKVGLIGANGVGKSTLLKLLLGQLEPDSGSLRVGTKIEVAYFDQLRAQLDPEKSVIDNVSEGRQSIQINGQQKHIISYLQDFLFTPERARTPVKALSGGERNRLLLARLFSKPANVLVLDEPTNDLDVETLELLENILMEFSGTVLLVSHDRAFLDNVVSSSLVFYGEGRIEEYVGGFEDWLRQGGSLDDLQQEQRAKEKKLDKVSVKSQKPEKAPKKQNKLSYKLQRELEQLPAEIEALEAEQQTLEAQTMEADFFAQGNDVTAPVLARLSELAQLLDEKMERWAELESLQAGE